MKLRYTYLMLLLLWCSFVGAQEQFNKVIYDSFGNISNTVIVHDDSYVVLTGTLIDNKRGFALTKIDLDGNVLVQKRYRKPDFLCFEGHYNCMKYDSLNNIYYMCGTAISFDYENKYPYVVELNQNLDTVSFNLIDIDSIYVVLDITKLAANTYAIACQSIIPDDYEMCLLIYNINGDFTKYGYGVADLVSNETCRQIIKTSNNELLLGGFSFGFNSGMYPQDWYLVKTDSIGNQIWEQHYGNPEVNDGYIGKIVETQDSLYLLSGGQGICVAYHEAILEAALRKVDTSGNLICEKFYRRYDFNSDDDEIRYSSMYVSDVIELEDGSFIATLNYKRSAGPGGNYRVRLLKTTCDGEILFSRTIKNTGIEYTQDIFSSSIKQTSDNGFIINGYGEYMWDYNPEQQFWLIKTDSLGCEGELYPAPPIENVECPNLPDTLYCGTSYDTKLWVQGKTAPYTLGFSTGETIEGLYYPPVFIPKFQGTGSFDVHVQTDIHVQTYDTATLYYHLPNEDTLPDIIVIPFTITVPENYPDTAISVSLTNGIGETFEITLPVYVWCDVSSPVTEFQEGIRLYPNPASNELHIQLSGFMENCFIKIVDMQGKTYISRTLSTNETLLNIHNLAAGSYIARVYQGNKIENIRFTKQ